MKTTINQRIKQVIEYRGLNISSFAKEIGVAQTSLRDVVNGGAEPKFSTLKKILIAEPTINKEWFMTGNGEMIEGIETSTDILERLNSYRKYLEHKDAEKFDLFMNSLRFNLRFEEMVRFVMNYENLSMLSQGFSDLDLNWVFTGKGSMLKYEVPEKHKISILAEKSKKAIPFYADLPVSAGQMGLSESKKDEQPSGYMEIPSISAEQLFPVIGCSMLPKIKAGDIIGVNKVHRWEKVEPDKIYMVITTEERMLKRLRIDNDSDDILWCVSDNYKEFKIYKNEIINIFHVVYHGELM